MQTSAIRETDSQVLLEDDQRNESSKIFGKSPASERFTNRATVLVPEVKKGPKTRQRRNHKRRLKLTWKEGGEECPTSVPRT